jgi:DNA-binding IclR family transcriptional regulator
MNKDSVYRTKPRQYAPAVTDAIAILGFLRREAPHTANVTEISRGLGISKSSCYIILQTLQVGGLVLQNPLNKTYALGPALVGLASVVVEETSAIAASRTLLPGLASRTGFPAGAWKLLPSGHLALVAHAAGTRPFQISFSVGQTFPLAPPFGAAFLAWLPRPELEHWLSLATAGGFGPSSEAELAYLSEDLRNVRERGYACAVRPSGNSDTALDELGAWLERAATMGLERSTAVGRLAYLEEIRRVSKVPDVDRSLDGVALPASLVSIVAPVFDPNGRVAIGIALIGFIGELPPERVVDIAGAVRDCADTLTAATGGIPPPGFPARGESDPALPATVRRRFESGQGTWG